MGKQVSDLWDPTLELGDPGVAKSGMLRAKEWGVLTFWRRGF